MARELQTLLTQRRREMLVIDGLTPDESRVAIACVRAIAEGPWFPPGNDGED